jgi:hypothetical protein
METEQWPPGLCLIEVTDHEWALKTTAKWMKQ